MVGHKYLVRFLYVFCNILVEGARKAQRHITCRTRCNKYLAKLDLVDFGLCMEASKIIKKVVPIPIISI